MKNLLFKLKQNEQDFEFYPTTNEILAVVKNSLKKNSAYSFLDIGAGNGKVLNALKDCKEIDINKFYAIEKSKILIDKLPANVFVIGTDFNTNTLIDKNIDVTFCNPPYKQYREWTIKIIKESNSKFIYLVIPERWKQDNEINSLLKKQNLNYSLLGSFDFLKSEDRKARAKVDVVCLTRENFEQEHDSFRTWFKENFNIKIEKDSYSSEYQEKKEKKEKKLKELTVGRNLIETLAELYQKDIKTLLKNYKAVESLNAEILNELDINVESLMEALRLKIKGLKNLYWQELFDNFSVITDKMTSKSRKSILSTLTDHTSVDFTCENAYAVIIWAIKNANKYYNSQLLEIYMEISDLANVKNYKSNKKIIDDEWRYNKKENTHYSLDYRIVHSCYCYDDFELRYSKNKLTDYAKNRINDIITIAKNLGFNVTGKAEDYEWKAGKENIFILQNHKVFAKIRPYKNGNLHIKFDQKFIKAFNVEAGRLNNWIKSPKEASYEMGISEKEMKSFFKTNQQITNSNVKLLS